MIGLLLNLSSLLVGLLLMLLVSILLLAVLLDDSVDHYDDLDCTCKELLLNVVLALEDGNE